LRNPFRADIDSVTGTIMIADVGDISWEEIDVCAIAGSNFAWPNYEGPAPYSNACGAPPSNAVFPVAQHHHLSGTHAIVSLAVYRNPPAPAPYAFGPAYEGDYFYSDHVDGKIRRLHPNGSTVTPAPPVPGQPDSESWAYTTPFNITDAVVGSDGALYYTQLFTGNIRRIRGGAPPGPSFSATTPSGAIISVQAGTPVTFTATAIAPPGPGASVTLSATAPPPTATLTPPLPVSGLSPQVTFSWTPTYFETGMWPMMFTATNQSGFVRTCTISVYVTDSILAVSSTATAPTPLYPGQDFVLIDVTPSVMGMVAIGELPAFAVPNDPSLIGFHFYAQVARYNPVLNPTDVLKLSNGLDIFINDEFLPYGPSSGLTLTGLAPYRPVIGSLATLVISQP
jgi:hypothetical protein